MHSVSNITFFKKKPDTLWGMAIFPDYVFYSINNFDLFKDFGKKTAKKMRGLKMEKTYFFRWR